jgi:hypothetical protein
MVVAPKPSYWRLSAAFLRSSLSRDHNDLIRGGGGRVARGGGTKARAVTTGFGPVWPALDGGPYHTTRQYRPFVFRSSDAGVAQHQLTRPSLPASVRVSA